MSTQLLIRYNKVYLKTFLFSNSFAENGIKVDSNTLDQKISKFIGADVILTPDKNHPREFSVVEQTGDHNIDVPKFRELQQKYRIGKIASVQQSSLRQAANNEIVYNAIIELDTQKGRNLYKNNLLPRYVSPSIYRTAGISKSDIKDFEVLHLALVSSPAYGVHRANIKGSCESSSIEEESTCMNRLAQADEHHNNEFKRSEKYTEDTLRKIIELPFKAVMEPAGFYNCNRTEH